MEFTVAGPTFLLPTLGLVPDCLLRARQTLDRLRTTVEANAKENYLHNPCRLFASPDSGRVVNLLTTHPTTPNKSRNSRHNKRQAKYRQGLILHAIDVRPRQDVYLAKSVPQCQRCIECDFRCIYELSTKHGKVSQG